MPGIHAFILFLCISIVVDSDILKNNSSQSIEKSNHESDSDKFLRFALNQDVVSDKFTDHAYQEMYSQFLVPQLRHKRAQKSNIKMLEIGLGCDQLYGPGASFHLWKRLLTRKDELWFAELNKTCVENVPSLRGENILLGDQSDVNTLHSWVELSTNKTGKFDVIIDDGGHLQHEIYTSFNILFPDALIGGGLYFIEDLQVSRHEKYKDTTGNGVVMLEVIKDWIEQMITREWVQPQHYKYKVPESIKSIFCQSHSCVIIKCRVNDTAHCTK